MMESEDDIIARFEVLTSGGDRDTIYQYEHFGAALRTIVRRKKIEIIRKLIEAPQAFVNNVKLDLWLELINLAAEKEFFEVFRELKKVENFYQQPLNQNQLEYFYKNVLDNISKLHADISNARTDEIEKFIQKYPKLKLCYGLENFCALERSIDARQFHTYAFLRAKGFYSDKGQELKDKIDELSFDDKERIRVEILKFSKPDPIGLILTKCDLDAASDVLNFQDIRQMLDELIKVEEIKPILEILAQSDVKIIFDYNEESVVAMDPTADEFTLGLAYFREGILYVGKNQNRAQRFGTFAHEATHFALFLLYENSCLPYREEDKERERVWEGIVQYFGRLVNNNYERVDNIIKWVYELYNPGYQHKAELIVRVNDLLAFYHENPQKCEEVRETYRELFDFYRNHVMPDLNMKNAYRIIKLNNDFKLFDEIKNSKFQVKESEKFHLLDFKQNIHERAENWSNERGELFHELAETLHRENIQNFLLLSDVPQLTLSKLFQEISKKSLNKLEAKVKNIFINFERLQQESLRKELMECEKSSDSLRIIVFFKVNVIERGNEEGLEILKAIKSPAKIFLVGSSNCQLFKDTLSNNFAIIDSKVEIESDNMIIYNAFQNYRNTQNSVKFLKIYLKHSWNDLTEKSKEENLKIEIKFRDETLLSSKFCRPEHPPSADVIQALSSQSKIKIEPKEPKPLKNFIERNFFMKIFNHQKSKFELMQLDLDEFIDRTKEDKIVVISDLAGSGKTTLLHKIHETLNEKFENFWVCFVSLLKNKEIVLDKKEISESFLDLMTVKILKFNELEKKIFEMKYKRDQVVILFDGFDEISPDCKRNAMKIFKLHKQSEKSQIWVTTRTHLEVDLERELQVETHKIEPLNEEEQIEFLCKFWEESCDDSNLREKCAKVLVKKVSEMNYGRESLIGITLQIQILGEYFEGQLSDDFDEKLKNLNFYQVYEFLIEKSVKSKEEKNSLHNTLTAFMRTYETFALKIFMGENHHLFGRTSQVDDLTDEELQEFIRGGIIFYDKDKKVFFTHLTYGEFLLSKFVKNQIENQIKNFKENWKYEEDFFKLIIEILKEEKFKVVKMFLDDAFKDQWKVFKAGNLTESQRRFATSFHNFLKDSNLYNLECFSSCEINENFFFFLLKCLTFKNRKLVEKFVEVKGQKLSNGVLKSLFQVEKLKNGAISRIFWHSNSEEILEEFLDDFFELYPTNDKVYEFLSLEYYKGAGTIFYQLVEEGTFYKANLKGFWSTIEKQNFGQDEIRNFFFKHGERNLFAWTLHNSDRDESGERIDAMIEVIKSQRNLSSNDKVKLLTQSLDKIGQLKYEQQLLSVIRFMHEICPSDKILDNFSKILAYASEFSTPGNLKIIFEEIFKFCKGNVEMTAMALNKNICNQYNCQTILMLAVKNVKIESFFYVLDEILVRLNKTSLEEIVFEVDNDGWNVLHHLAKDGKKALAEQFLKRIEEKNPSILKKLLASKAKDRTNVFHLLIQNINDGSTKYLIALYLKTFEKGELRGILSQANNEKGIPLNNESEEYKNNFYLIFALYESLFNETEIKKLLRTNVRPFYLWPCTRTVFERLAGTPLYEAVRKYN